MNLYWYCLANNSKCQSRSDSNSHMDNKNTNDILGNADFGLDWKLDTSSLIRNSFPRYYPAKWKSLSTQNRAHKSPLEVFMLLKTKTTQSPLVKEGISKQSPLATNPRNTTEWHKGTAIPHIPCNGSFAMLSKWIQTLMVTYLQIYLFRSFLTQNCKDIRWIRVWPEKGRGWMFCILMMIIGLFFSTLWTM